MDHLGAAIGPVLATLFLLVWPNALRSLFLLTAIPGAIVVLMLWCGLREPEQHGSESMPGSSTPTPFDKNFIRFLIAMLLFTLGNSSDAFLLVRAEEVGVPVVYLPLLWAVFHVAKSAGNLVAGSWVDRIGPRTMLLFGWAFYATIYLAFAVATSRTAIIALFVAYAAYYALTEPAEKTMVSMLVPRGRRGTAYGWFHGAIGFAAFPSSMIFGGLYERWGYTAAFGFGALQSVIAMSVLLAVRSPSATADRDGSTNSESRGD
jgi:predicted MFS family arabinose efflux permease